MGKEFENIFVHLVQHMFHMLIYQNYVIIYFVYCRLFKLSVDTYTHTHIRTPNPLNSPSNKLNTQMAHHCLTQSDEPKNINDERHLVQPFRVNKIKWLLFLFSFVLLISVSFGWWWCCSKLPAYSTDILCKQKPSDNHFTKIIIVTSY